MVPVKKQKSNLDMDLQVLRRFLCPTYTIGRFTIDSVYFCDTLEDKVRDLNDYNHDGDFDDSGEGKIYGETAIPAGRYKVIVSYSPKLKRRLPLLLDVPGFTGIRIHSLVTARGTEGCIGVGQNRKKGQLTNGPYFETTLVQRIDEAIKNKEEVFITIKQ